MSFVLLIHYQCNSISGYQPEPSVIEIVCIHTYTRSHSQRRTCTVYILAIISEPNFGTSGVINKSNIVLSGKNTYIKGKKIDG